MAYLKETVYHTVRNWRVRRQQKELCAKWEDAGRPVPPPHLVKQRMVLECAKQHGLEILVETGTYLGDMVEAMRSHFAKVYSIELSADLYEKARRRFHGAKNVELIQGDSGQELGKLIPKLDRPTLFWLDGHYSGGITARGEKDAPILEELGHIFKLGRQRSVILIDDARLCGKYTDYPALDEIRKYVLEYYPDAKIHVENDSIHIVGSKGAQQ